MYPTLQLQGGTHSRCSSLAQHRVTGILFVKEPALFVLSSVSFPEALLHSFSK